MKKGDKVTIDVNAAELAYKKLQSAHLGTGLSANHPFFSTSLHPEIIKRAKAGQTATITGISHSRGKYANLKFDDGFECGMDCDDLTKI